MRELIRAEPGRRPSGRRFGSERFTFQARSNSSWLDLASLRRPALPLGQDRQLCGLLLWDILRCSARGHPARIIGKRPAHGSPPAHLHHLFNGPGLKVSWPGDAAASMTFFSFSGRNLSET
jgi:hypothetical protein